MTIESQPTEAIHDAIMSVGSRVREARRARGWTQLELAAQSGISRASIAQIETGVLREGSRLGTIARLLLMCGEKVVFEVTKKDEILSSEGEQKPPEAGTTEGPVTDV